MKVFLRLNAALLVLALSLTMFVSPAFAATLVVDGGNESCDDTDGDPVYCTIQAAINAASNSDVITVAAGTYTELVTVNKEVTITGVGDGDDDSANTILTWPAGSGTIVTISADNVTLNDLRIDHNEDPLTQPSANIRLETVDNVTFNGITSTEARNGLLVSSSFTVDGLTIDDSHFDGNREAWYLAKETSASNPHTVKNVLVTNTTFNNNTNKGIYAEKLEDAVFDGITMTDTGTNAAYGFNNGIDINLKWAAYANITIQNSTFTGTGLSGAVPNFAAAITIKARDQGGYASTPASLSGVTIDNVAISGGLNGIRFGEPHGANPYQAAMGLVVVSNSNITGVDVDALVNETLGDITATSNWWESANGPEHAGNTFNVGSQGQSISGNGDGEDVTYVPWLNAAAPGGADFAPATNGALNYSSIQAAVDAALAGNTINLAAGSFNEQVVIDGTSLTLDGAGATTVIRPLDPDMLTSFYTLGTQGGGALWDGNTLASIVNVMNVGAAGVSISDLKIDGQDVDAVPAGLPTYVVGLSYGETGGLVSNVVVEDMDFLPDAQRSYGMWFDAVGGTAVSVEVNSSTVQFYNRNGINARGNSMTVDIHDSEVDGAGPIPGQVLNGILLINGADGQIVDNNIHDNGYIGDTWKGSGILLYQTVTGILISGNEIHDTDDAIILNATNSALIDDNNLHNNYKGVQLEAAAATSMITNNLITDNDYGIFLNESAGDLNEAHENEITGASEYGVWNVTSGNFVFDATGNWWGDATGPLDDSDTLTDACALAEENDGGLGVEVSGCVSYTPWSGILPETPVLVDPANFSLIADHTPTFDWEDTLYAETYQLQISRTPAFSDLRVDEEGISDSEFTLVDPLNAKETYYWRVRGFNEEDAPGPWSDVSSFQTTMFTPQLLNPADGALLTNLKPNLEWKKGTLSTSIDAAGFTGYTVQVASDSGFTSLIIDVTVPKTTTSYKITSGLDFDTTYWWRVRAEHTSYGPSGWSEVRTFDTPVAAPAAPVLLTPADDAVLTDRTPDFDWEDSAGATKYKIQISVKADFSTMISKAKVETSEFTQPTNLPLNKTLYWRVKAIGPGGKSAWSEVWTFTIIE